MLDTGLLSSEYGAQPVDFEGKDLCTATFHGGVTENYVMQQMVAGDIPAYYWGQQSTYEVDFVVRLREGVVPIEVKSGARVRAKSARRFAEKYDCPFLIHMTAKNFGEAEGVRSIPLYAACLMSEL